MTHSHFKWELDGLELGKDYVYLFDSRMFRSYQNNVFANAIIGYLSGNDGREPFVLTSKHENLTIAFYQEYCIPVPTPGTSIPRIISFSDNSYKSERSMIKIKKYHSLEESRGLDFDIRLATTEREQTTIRRYDTLQRILSYIAQRKKSDVERSQKQIENTYNTYNTSTMSEQVKGVLSEKEMADSLRNGTLRVMSKREVITLGKPLFDSTHDNKYGKRVVEIRYPTSDNRLTTCRVEGSDNYINYNNYLTTEPLHLIDQPGLRVKTEQELAKTDPRSMSVSFINEMYYTRGKAIDTTNVVIDTKDNSFKNYVVDGDSKPSGWWLSFNHVTTNPLNTTANNSTNNTTTMPITSMPIMIDGAPYTPSTDKYDWRFKTLREIQGASDAVKTSIGADDITRSRANCIGSTITSLEGESNYLNLNRTLAGIYNGESHHSDCLTIIFNILSRPTCNDYWSYERRYVKDIITNKPLHLYDHPDARVKTKAELEKEFGSNWRNVRIHFATSMDTMLGVKLKDIGFVAKDSTQSSSYPQFDANHNIRLRYSSDRYVTVSPEFITTRPLPKETEQTVDPMSKVWYIKSKNRVQAEHKRLLGEEVSSVRYLRSCGGKVDMSGERTRSNLSTLLAFGNNDKEGRTLDIIEPDGSRDYWQYYRAFLTDDIAETKDEPVMTVQGKDMTESEINAKVSELLGMTWYVKSPKRVRELEATFTNSVRELTHDFHKGRLIINSARTRADLHKLLKDMVMNVNRNTYELDCQNADGSIDYWYYRPCYLTTDISLTIDEPETTQPITAQSTPVKPTKEKAKPEKTKDASQYQDTMVLCTTKSQMNRVYDHLKATRVISPYNVKIFDIYDNECQFGYSSFKDNGDSYCIWLIGKPVTNVFVTRDARKARYSGIPNRAHMTVSYEQYMTSIVASDTTDSTTTSYKLEPFEFDLECNSSIQEVQRQVNVANEMMQEAMSVREPQPDRPDKTEGKKPEVVHPTTEMKPATKTSSKPATVFNADEW